MKINDLDLPVTTSAFSRRYWVVLAAKGLSFISRIPGSLVFWLVPARLYALHFY